MQLLKEPEDILGPNWFKKYWKHNGGVCHLPQHIPHTILLPKVPTEVHKHTLAILMHVCTKIQTCVNCRHTQNVFFRFTPCFLSFMASAQSCPPLADDNPNSLLILKVKCERGSEILSLNE